MNVYKVFNILVLTILVLTAGCGRKHEEGKETVTIEFMNFESSPTGLAFYQKLIQEFEKRNPDIKVKNNPVSGRYDAKLQTRFAGGTSPDIFEVWTGNFIPYIQKGVVMNLDSFVEESKTIDLNDFFLSGIFNFYYNKDKNIPGSGSLYGLPKDFGALSLLYNKDLFDRAHLSYPDETWTFKEYLDAAEKLTIRDPQGRFVQIGIEQMVEPLCIVTQMGKDWWSEDYTQCLLDSPEGIKAYQMWYDLQHTYKVAVKQQAYHGRIEKGMSYCGFKSGKAGMKYAFRYEIPDLSRDVGDRFGWGVAPLPLIGKQRRSPNFNPCGWAVSSQTKHPKETLRFLEYLCSKEVYGKSAELGWNIPPLKSVAYSEHFLSHPQSALHPEGVNKVFLDPLSDEKNNIYMCVLNPYISMRKFMEITDYELHYEKIEKEGMQFFEVNIALKASV